MRPDLVLSLAGAGLVALLVGLALLPAHAPPPTPSGAPVAVAPLAAPAVETPAVARDVTPPGVTPPPRVDGPLVRVDPPSRPVARKDDGWKPRLFHRAVAEDGYVFRAPAGRAAPEDGGAEVLIRLDGIEPPAETESCADAEGTARGCRAFGLARLRAYLRGRALSCLAPRESVGPGLVTTCKVGGEDVGGWLVAQGLARPAAAGRYGTEAEAARAARLGLHAR